MVFLTFVLIQPYLKKLIYISLCLLISTIGQSQTCEVGGSYFSTFEDIKSILDNNNCSGCHSDSAKEGDWNYDTYESFVQSGFCNQSIIEHGNASNSYLYSLLIGSDDICSESLVSHKVQTEDLDQLETWINQGAPELCMPLYPDIKDILDINNCQSCHNATNEEWTYNTYNEMLGYTYDSECDEYSIMVKGSASASLLYDKINNDDIVACGDPMNGESAPLNYEEIAKIRDWINGGALESQFALPVILSKFETQEKNQSVSLDWTTELEVATDKFIVERSSTGRNFAEITEVVATGGDSGPTSYTFVDDSPVNGENYYRLKIVDLDGSFDYSNIRLTRLEVQTAEMIISPNPAMSSERLKVTWYPVAGQERTYLNLVDPNGRSLHRKIIFEGTNYVRLPTLLDGVYYVIIEDYFGGFLLERVVIIN